MLRRYPALLAISIATLTAMTYFAASAPPDDLAGRRILTVAISRSGRFVAAGAESGWIGLWDRERPDAQQQFRAAPEGDPAASDLAFGPDERLLAIAQDDLKLYPVEMGALRTLRDDHRQYSSIRFHPSGSQMLTVTGGIRIETIDASSGEVLKNACCAGAGGIAYSASGDWFVAADDPPSIWNSTTGEHIGRLAYPPDATPSSLARLGAVAVDTERGLILIGSGDGRIYGWDAKTRKVRVTSPPLAGPVEHLTALHQSPWIAYSSADAPIRLWNPDTGEVRQLDDAVASSTLAAGPQPGTVLFGNYAGSVDLWDVETGKPVDRFTLR